jgi:hypothetical protein
MVGDDFPFTKGFAQEGASEEMSLSLAIVAVTISTSAGTSFVLRYITPSAALVVGVVNLLVVGFLGFVDRVIRADFRHLVGPPWGRLTFKLQWRRAGGSDPVPVKEPRLIRPLLLPSSRPPIGQNRTLTMALAGASL